MTSQSVIPRQLDLPSDPLSRNTDPAASFRAAEEETRSGRRTADKRRVLEALSLHECATSKELARITGLDRHMVARRLPDLEHDRLVIRGSAGDTSDTCWVTAAHATAMLRSGMIEIRDNGRTGKQEWVLKR